MLDDDQDAGFQFQMDPEPGTTLSPHHYGAPGFDSLAADAMSECSSLSTNILDISLSTFDPGSIATSLSTSAGGGTLGMSAMDLSRASAPGPAMIRQVPSSSRSTPRKSLQSAVSMGTAPPDALSYCLSQVQKTKSAPVSLPGSFGAVGMGTTPSDNPLLSSFQFKPKVATHSDDRFNYVVPNGKRVEYYHQVEVDVQVGMEKDFSEVLRITSLEEDGEEDGIIAPPSCTAGPSLADLGDLFRTPPLRGGGERPPLPGLPRVPTPPHTGEVHVAQGFTVSQDVFQSAPNRLQSTPLKPPLSPSSLEGQQQKTPGLLSSASSLAGAVGKRAATMWGSAIDLVSMTQSPGGSSPRSSEDESTRPPHGRGLTRQGSQRNDSLARSKSSWNGINSSRIPSVQDLVSFMWAESAPNGTGGLPPKPPSASKQRQAPLNGLPLNGLPDGRGDGRLCRVPSWSGMRHRHLSNQQPKAANPKPGLRKRGVQASYPSAPNLAALDTSGLVSATGRAHNLTRFEDQYRMTTSLGTGGYAVVRRCIHLATGEEYAVKIMQLAELKDERRSKDGDEGSDDEDDRCLSLREINNELSMMCKLSHPNIIKIHEFFVQDGQCFVVMQLLQGPELMDALVEIGQKAGKDDGEVGSYTEADARTVMASLTDAIAYMHEAGITHRDLKLENLVLAEPGKLSSVVIVDFGLAKAARAREKMEETCGTPWYSSPELLQGEPYTQAVDLWSLGVAMYVLLTGDFPFDHEDEDELMDLIIDGDVHMDGPKWEMISPQAKDLVRGLLEVDPKKRLTAVEAIEHPWFTGEIEVRAAASVLHHAHLRLSRLVECAPGRLPVAIFQPGQWIAREGERGKEVYMILEGEAEVLRDRNPEDPPPPPNCDPPAYRDYFKVRTLRKGNFAGQLAQSLVASRSRRSLDRSHTSLAESLSSRPSPSSEDIHQALLEATKAQVQGVKIPPSPIAVPDDWGLSPAGSGLSSLSDVSDSTSLSASHHSPSPKGGLAAFVSPQPVDWVNRAMKGLGVISALVRVRRNWVGHRRTASIRAVTQVKALVLNRDDMHWAVEHDYRLTHELQDAMRKQRKKLRAKMREIRKKKQDEKCGDVEDQE